MQYRPNAPELLSAIAELLEGEVLPAAPPALQHKVRVAAHLAGMLEREQHLGAENDRRERELLAGLLGHDGEVPELSAELAGRLRTGGNDALEAAAWPALVEIARADLAIAKPGHDGWEGQ
jgi:hypothetical protein